MHIAHIHVVRSGAVGWVLDLHCRSFRDFVFYRLLILNGCSEIKDQWKLNRKFTEQILIPIQAYNIYITGTIACLMIDLRILGSRRCSRYSDIIPNLYHTLTCARPILETFLVSPTVHPWVRLFSCSLPIYLFLCFVHQFVNNYNLNTRDRMIKLYEFITLSIMRI